MTSIVEILGGEFAPPKPVIRHSLPPDQQFIQAMCECGLDAPDNIQFDGEFHRFGRKKSSWYVAFGGPICAGRFGDWREGVDSLWRQDLGRDIAITEQFAFNKAKVDAQLVRDAALSKLREDTAHRATEIWESAQIASDDHPYLARKQVPNLAGLKVATDGRLIAPCYFNGAISGLQYIASDGSKLWMKGSKAGGAWWHIGDLSRDGVIYIAEGVATATTIHQVTERPVIIAFSAQNIPVISKYYEVKLTQNLIVVADNDESGTGERCAKESGLPYFMPPTVGQDANDFVSAGGDLLALLNPPKVAECEPWLVSADEWSGQPASINWMVKKWLQKDALMMVHGPSGGGKTFLVLDWCLRLAAGMPDWAGHKIHAGNVVYLAGEGHHGLRGRIAAWRQYHEPASLNMWLSRGGCDLNRNEGIMKAMDNINSLPVKPDLIVVDTLHRFLAGDENSAQDAKEMLDACAMLMDSFGCSVLLVHHTGVSDDAQHRARGSSAWRGALDIEISVVPTGDKIEIIQRKSKDAELAMPVFCELESVEIDGWLDEDGEPVTSAILKITDAPVKVKKMSKAHLLLVQAYRTAADSGMGVCAGGEFVGVDRGILRDFYYEIYEASAEAKKKAFSRSLEEMTKEGDFSETGECIICNLPEVTICHGTWGVQK